jgi:hypothetical protein
MLCSTATITNHTHTFLSPLSSALCNPLRLMPIVTQADGYITGNGSAPRRFFLREPATIKLNQ